MRQRRQLPGHARVRRHLARAARTRACGCQRCRTLRRDSAGLRCARAGRWVWLRRNRDTRPSVWRAPYYIGIMGRNVMELACIYAALADPGEHLRLDEELL